MEKFHCLTIKIYKDVTKIKKYNILPKLGRWFFTGPLWPDIELKVGASMPAVNIKEDGQQFNIEVAAPGMEKKDFKLDLNHNVLTISAEKEEEKEEEIYSQGV